MMSVSKVLEVESCRFRHRAHTVPTAGSFGIGATLDGRKVS